jgi:hypothetical protein
MTNANQLIYNESKIAPKANDQVWVRLSPKCHWELATFISETKSGFQVYKHCINRAEYIDCFAELTTKDPYWSEVFIFSK